MLAIIFAQGSGTRLAKISGGTPKHLLEIDPQNQLPIKRTILGRLISQFLGEKEIKKVIIICNKKTPFEEKLKPTGILGEKVTLVESPTQYNWKKNIELLDQLIGKNAAVIVPGDIILEEAHIKRGIKFAKRCCVA